MLVYFKKAAGGLFGNTAVYKLVELWDKKKWLPRSVCSKRAIKIPFLTLLSKEVLL